jgi:hypothetical protein
MIPLKKVLIINKFDIMHGCHYYTSSMRKIEKSQRKSYRNSRLYSGNSVDESARTVKTSSLTDCKFSRTVKTSSLPDGKFSRTVKTSSLTETTFRVNIWYLWCLKIDQELIQKSKQNIDRACTKYIANVKFSKGP